MNNILIAEIKRILKKRLSKTIIIITILISILLAYLPSTYKKLSYIDKNEIISLSGVEAIRYERLLQKNILGEVTPDKFRIAVSNIKKTMIEYNVSSQYELEPEIYGDNILPYSDLVHRVKEVFSDSKTGYAPSVLNINLKEIDESFYNKCTLRLDRIMRNVAKESPLIRSKASNMYKKVDKPFVYRGTNGDAFDYQTFTSLILLFACVILVAPIFSSDYQTGAEDIQRCTKYGGLKLGLIKTLSSILICSVLYLVSMSIYIIISNSLFGWEITETSIQLLFSAQSLPNWNIGKLQWLLVFGGFGSLLATISFTLYISSLNKNVMVPTVAGLLICVAPILFFFISSGLNKEMTILIQAFIPSSSGGIWGSMFDSVRDFNFIQIGQIVIWHPVFMIIVSFIEFIIFTILTIISYKNYRE